MTGIEGWRAGLVERDARLCSTDRGLRLPARQRPAVLRPRVVEPYLLRATVGWRSGRSARGQGDPMSTMRCRAPPPCPTVGAGLPGSPFHVRSRTGPTTSPRGRRPGNGWRRPRYRPVAVEHEPGEEDIRHPAGLLLDERGVAIGCGLAAALVDQGKQFGSGRWRPPVTLHPPEREGERHTPGGTEKRGPECGKWMRRWLR
jgi:hypothetical protein